ncbi:LysR family transcriptional regulator [Shewanella yunxiaonensis]|uniref:LysR family transcriptional regulator n=1 Tax=Shewanella yunxiaonensis TaxID=2829809 RepID=A0ABX7YTJ5_9GAMM|nr:MULTISPECIES: LysR family transcriptional regulator [Shewanella]MDF0534633.1 LysR family transcriptional regulator [Shewanella sp. A32]QUN05992.1 LysR family transcriptional regulator [Shewanella yunxiaonensis]
MDLNRVQIFAQVVEQGSFTGAANALGLTKTTVSRKVAELEKQTGVQLLFRTTRALRLTEAGAEYYNKITKILLDLENAEAQLSASQQRVKGNLHVVCPFEMGQLFMGPVFACFLESYPDIRIDTELSNRNVDLIAEGVDILFHVGMVEDSRLQTYRLFNTSTVLVASPSYLKRFGHPQQPEELWQHKYIDLYTSLAKLPSEGQIRIFDGQQWQSITPKIQFRVNNITLAREVAIAGLGIAALPPMIVEEAIKSGELVPLLEDFPMEHNVLGVSFPKRAYLPRKYIIFIDFVYQVLFRYKADELLEKPDFVHFDDEKQSKCKADQYVCDGAEVAAWGTKLREALV